MNAPSPVSIVIPCYNAGAYLGECLQSLLAQDCPAWEAVVVDDASTAGDPAAIVAQFHDPRIRCLRHETNRGLGAARNTGFESATTPLVLPLDADDLLAPRFLRSLLTMMEADPTLDCAFCDFELFGARSGIRAMRVEPLGALTRYQWLPGAGVLVKRDLWQRAGKYSEDPVLRLGNEDWDFWLRAAGVGFRAAHLAEPLYRYRQHTHNMSQDLSAADHVTRRYLLRRHRSFFDRHGAARGFLATGYWTAAEVARRRRRVLRSLALGARAMMLDGDWRQGRRLAQNNVSMLLPGSLRRALQALKPLKAPRRRSLDARLSTPSPRP
jgi:glycosyltransferase involved in cell wall biosynthesis